MSALSISSVAASGSSTQAPAQPGAADATDTSPFALLLAALTAVDPEFQPALPSTATPAPTQSDALQAPAARTGDGQTSGTPAVRLSAVSGRDAGIMTDLAGTDIADTAADPTASAAQTSVTDPGDVTAAKSGKPDKKAATDKLGTDDTVGALPVQASVMPQLPIPPMAQAAVQTQTVAANDDDSDISATDALGTAPAPTLQAQAGSVSRGKPIAPAPDASEPVSSQPIQPGIKQVATQPVTQPIPANDDDTGDDEDLNSTVADLQTKTVAHTGAKSPPLHNAPGKPVSQAAAPPQPPALADDADADLEPSGMQNPTGTPSQMAAQTLQPHDTAAENTAAVFTAQQTPQKSAAAKPAPDKVANAASPAGAANTGVSASTNDPAQSAAPAPTLTTDKDSDSKSAHAATSAAPQPQTDTPPSAQPPAAGATPQTTLAINAAGTPSQNGPTLSLHVATHTSDSQSATPSNVTPNTDGLAISIAARSLSGSKQFDIRLDPPELGRVDVRLSIDASGKTQAHMTTDQPQTLALLQKDAPNLTRALRDAGLDVSQNGLNFSLKGQSQNQGGQGNQFAAPSRSISLPAMAQAIESVPSASALSSLLGNARLDIHV